MTYQEIANYRLASQKLFKTNFQTTRKCTASWHDAGACLRYDQMSDWFPLGCFWKNY